MALIFIKLIQIHVKSLHFRLQQFPGKNDFFFKGGFQETATSSTKVSLQIKLQLQRYCLKLKKK